jgi:hypothetical protein
MKVSLDQAAAILRQKARALQQQVRSAEAQSAQEALATAHAYSSGPFSTRMLQIMGHPYSRRNPRPPGNPAVVNRQSGRFRSSWRVMRQGDRTRLVNDAPYAQYFNDAGTVRMMRRPILRAIAQKIRRNRERRLARAVAAALK